MAATSASNAWAVGETDTLAGDLTVILHWNGTRWARAASPDPGASNTLAAVAATSATSAWAVGYSTTGGIEHTLILHWNGRTWRKVPSPGATFGTNSALQGVAATGANAWASGFGYDNTGTNKAFILRWSGRSWHQVAIQDLGAGVNSFLQGIAAASGSNAWAVGSAGSGPAQAFAIHCC